MAWSAGILIAIEILAIIDVDTQAVL